MAALSARVRKDVGRRGCALWARIVLDAANANPGTRRFLMGQVAGDHPRAVLNTGGRGLTRWRCGVRPAWPNRRAVGVEHAIAVMLEPGPRFRCPR